MGILRFTFIFQGKLSWCPLNLKRTESSEEQKKTQKTKHFGTFHLELILAGICAAGCSRERFTLPGLPSSKTEQCHWNLYMESNSKQDFKQGVRGTSYWVNSRFIHPLKNAPWELFSEVQGIVQRMACPFLAKVELEVRKQKSGLKESSGFIG